MLSKKSRTDKIVRVSPPLTWHPLTPFESNVLPLDLRAAAYFKNGLLTARFQMSGSVGAIFFPDPSPQPKRCDRIWESTCFEVFVGMAGRDAYWEFNFSPAGDWASYRFTGYRSGMIPEERISYAACHSVGSSTGCREWEVTADVSGIPEFCVYTPLFFGIATIIEMKNRDKSHWALLHCGEKPDFHRRESFISKSF